MEKNNNKPKLRFPGFTYPWEQRKLNEIADVLDGDRGNNYPNGNEFQERGHTLFLSASNVTTNGFMFDDTQYITEEKSNSMGNGKLLLDDIVLTSRGSIGHIAWYNKAILQQVPFARINSGMLILRSKDFVMPCFVAQFLKSPLGKRQIDLISFGSAQPQLTKKDVSNYVVSIPSDSNEQSKLGIFFDNIDKLITLHQRKLNHLQDKKKSLLQKMFPKNGQDFPKIRFPGFTDPWEQRKFEDIFKLSQGLQIPISQRFLTEGENKYFYITNEFLKSTCDEKYYIENPPQSVICNQEDILMTRTGNTGIVVTDVEGCFHNNFFKIQYDKELFDKHFIVQLLSTESMKRRILNSAGSSTIPDLSHKSFYKLDSLFPEIDEQKKISEFILALNNLITLHQRKLNHLKEQKKALLQQMFV